MHVVSLCSHLFLTSFPYFDYLHFVFDICFNIVELLEYLFKGVR